jgi:spermidine/putrescine transport system substrate-binding protein
MEAIDPSLVETYPNLGMTSEELFAGEELVDLGEAGPMYTQIATEIAAQ